MTKLEKPQVARHDEIVLLRGGHLATDLGVGSHRLPGPAADLEQI